MTNNLSDQNENRQRYAWYILFGIGMAGGIYFLYLYLARPPQMGTSDEVFTTVDSLYTAIRSKDEKNLGKCESRLKGYREQGKLPTNAANALSSIIETARSGSWSNATHRLYEFMLAQKREGVLDHVHPHNGKKGISSKK